MKLQDLKNEALKDPKFRKEYESYDLAFEIGQMVVQARLFKGMTQHKLASLLNTKQPSIARLENGQQLPSLSFLQRIANAFGTYLLAPQFAELKLHKNVNSDAKTSVAFSPILNHKSGNKFKVEYFISDGPLTEDQVINFNPSHQYV